MMTIETAGRVEKALKSLQKKKSMSSEDKMLLTDVLRVALPDSCLSKEAERLSEGQKEESSTTGDIDKGLIDLINSALLLVPLHTESVISSESNLGQHIETVVRVALNDKFRTSVIFVGSVGALLVAATLFTFGLVRVESRVTQADVILKQFDKQLADARNDMAKDEADIKDRLRAARKSFEDEIDKSEQSLAQAQKDSLAALDKNLQQQVTQVEHKKNQATGQISALTTDFENDKKNAGVALAKEVETIKPDLQVSAAKALKAMSEEHANQVTALKHKADTALASLTEPAIGAVIGKAYWFMVTSFFLSILSIAGMLWARPWRMTGIIRSIHG